MSYSGGAERNPLNPTIIFIKIYHLYKMDILLIIDMQKALFDIPRFDSSGVLNRINVIAENIRSKSGKVVFIQHDGSKEEGLFPNS